MAKLSRPTNHTPLTPSVSLLQSTLLDVVRDQDTWKDHRKTSRAACLPQELAAENSRGWARIFLFSSTQTASADQLSVHRDERQSGKKTLRFICAARMQSAETVSSSSIVPFPSNFHTSKKRDHNRNFTCFPTCPFVSHSPVIVCVISTLKSWSVPSCRVSCCPATTYDVCLQCRSFPPGVVPCPASPCHACQTTTRSFSRCHHSPDDVIWLTHRNRARASGELHLFNSEVILVQVDSDTVPHHLSERFPTRHQKITQDAARISKKVDDASSSDDSVKRHLR